MSIFVVHNVIIIGTTVGYVFSASCSNYAFHAGIFSAQQTFTTSYFRRTILGLVGKISSWLKINKRGGAALRMSWCAFFEKINSRGGRLFRTGEYAVLEGDITHNKHCCLHGPFEIENNTRCTIGIHSRISAM